MDRIDLKVLVSEHDDSDADVKSYASVTLRATIKGARELQAKRYHSAEFGRCNADVPDGSQILKYMPAREAHVEEALSEANQRLELTPRMRVKLIKVAQTICDLEEARSIRKRDVEEAIELMGLYNEYFRGTLK